MKAIDLNFAVSRLGECQVPSPLTGTRFVIDGEHVLYHAYLGAIKSYLEAGMEPPCLELAGPREKIYFDPVKLTCGIVTCGGLCPVLNDVIRAITLTLIQQYGVPRVLGFGFGYEGLSARYGHAPLELTPESVAAIHEMGGTILGSSRGTQDIGDMVDTLERLNIGILFAIGGDGTLKGAQAIAKEIARRGLKIAVIGIPKTIDNDISFIQQSFGFDTASSEARRAIYSAHSEALGARNGVGLVKLMGRDSGFIAAYAVLANSQGGGRCSHRVGPVVDGRDCWHHPRDCRRRPIPGWHIRFLRLRTAIRKPIQREKDPRWQITWYDPPGKHHDNPWCFFFLLPV